MKRRICGNILLAVLFTCSLISGILSVIVAKSHWDMYAFYVSINFSQDVMQNELSKFLMLLFASIFSFIIASLALGLFIVKNTHISKWLYSFTKQKQEAKQHEKNTKSKIRKQKRIEQLQAELDELKKDGE